MWVRIASSSRSSKRVSRLGTSTQASSAEAGHRLASAAISNLCNIIFTLLYKYLLDIIIDISNDIQNIIINNSTFKNYRIVNWFEREKLTSDYEPLWKFLLFQESKYCFLFLEYTLHTYFCRRMGSLINLLLQDLWKNISMLTHGEKELLRHYQSYIFCRIWLEIQEKHVWLFQKTTTILSQRLNICIWRRM